MRGFLQPSPAYLHIVSVVSATIGTDLHGVVSVLAATSSDRLAHCGPLSSATNSDRACP